MNKLVVFNHLTGKDEETTFENFTGLKIGDRIYHAKKNQHGGNGTTISSQLGTITGFQDQGDYHWGGHCVTVDVKWDDNSESRMIYNLAVKEV